MRCPHCQTLIEGATRICPLCGKAVESSEQTPAYPPRQKRVKLYSNSFTLYYTFAAMILTLICTVANLYLHPSLPWWIAAAVSCILIHFFIRHTILGIRNIASKLCYITIAALIFMIGIFTLFDIKYGFVWYLPIFSAIFSVCVYVYVFATFRKSKAHLLALSVGSSTCFIPLMICLVKGYTLLPSIVVAVYGAVGSLFPFLYYFKETISELKRFYAV